MSFIAFELKALERAPHVARAAGLAEDSVIAGLTRTWAHCWREKVDHLTPIQVRGLFGGDACQALEAFGFLELDGAQYRVKGADRYLRITEARSRGGKAAAGNLKRGTRLATASAPAEAGSQPEVEPGVSPGFAPALSSSIEHRASKKETTPVAVELDPVEPPTPSPVVEIFEHWRTATGKTKAKLDKPRRALIAKTLETYPASDVKKCITGYTRSPHHIGHNKRRIKYLDLELMLRDAAHVEAGIEHADNAPKMPEPPRRPSAYDGLPSAAADLSCVCCGVRTGAAAWNVIFCGECLALVERDGNDAGLQQAGYEAWVSFATQWLETRERGAA